MEMFKYKIDLTLIIRSLIGILKLLGIQIVLVMISFSIIYYFGLHLIVSFSIFFPILVWVIYSKSTIKNNRLQLLIVTYSLTALYVSIPNTKEIDILTALAIAYLTIPLSYIILAILDKKIV